MTTPVTLAQYHDAIRRAVESALCIGQYPSRTVERHDKPEVEVGDRFASSQEDAHGPDHSPHSGGPVHEETPELLLAPVRITRGEQESCLVEASVNSARVSLTFQKNDPLTALVVQKYMSFMGQRASQFHILRRRPIEGFDVSFLITHREVAAMGRTRIVDFIIAFAQGVNADVAALKMSLNERARAAAVEFYASTVAALPQ